LAGSPKETKMPDYRQTTGQATTWLRAHSITISNPLAGQGQGGPTITFSEQEVLQMGERVIVTPSNTGPDWPKLAFDPAASITLLNPETGAPTGGTMSHTQLYTAIYSLYMQAAAERDARALPPAPPAPAPTPAAPGAGNE
jgi:hypothetical protein